MNGQIIIRTGDLVKSKLDNKMKTVIHLVTTNGALRLYESVSNIYEIHMNDGSILKIGQIELLK